MLDSPDMTSIVRSSRHRYAVEAERLLQGSSAHGRMMLEFGATPLTRREEWALGVVAELVALLKSREDYDEDTSWLQTQQLDQSKYTYGSLVVDCSRREVSVDGHVIELTPKEYVLIVALAERSGAAVSLEALSRRLWNRPFDRRSRALYQLIGELRRKVEKDPRNPRFIRIVRKYGYRLAAA
ncbi:MAG TPA: winged helix-turn-helix domain-containing protein [Gemmatimonadaceae bacterium]